MSHSQSTSPEPDAASRRDAPVVALTAFGKHPGWDDHIDDIELGTTEMVDLKRWLYIDGLRPNIDSGAWEKLEAEQRLDAFDHVFAWRRGDHLLIGRMWSSRDGKGRTKYPMIVCAQVRGEPNNPVLSHVCLVLEEARHACSGAEDATSVRAALDVARRRLADDWPSDVPQGRRGGDDALAEISLSPLFRAAPDGLIRVLYQIERDMKAFLPMSRDAKSSAASVTIRSQHLRVPTIHHDPADSLATWLGFLANRLASSASIAAMVPRQGTWMDIIVGDPMESQLQCIRATPKSVACTHDIPYDIDAETRSRLQRILDGATDRATASSTGPAPATDASADSPSTAGSGPAAPQAAAQRPSAGSSHRSMWPLFLLVVLLLGLLVVAITLMVMRS